MDRRESVSRASSPAGEELRLEKTGNIGALSGNTTAIARGPLALLVLVTISFMVIVIVLVYILVSGLGPGAAGTHGQPTNGRIGAP